MLSREVDELSMVLNYFQLRCTLVTGAQVKRKYVSDYLHCPFPVCKVPVELVEAGISMLFDCSIFNTHTLNIIYASKYGHNMQSETQVVTLTSVQAV